MPQADVVPGQRFSDFLEELERGEFAHDCSVQLAKVVREVQRTGKAGSLTLKFKLKPTDRSGKQVEIDKDLGVTLPKYPRQKSLAYPQEDGSLLREDPRQTTIQEFDSV